jgi:hypothetical protein
MDPGAGAGAGARPLETALDFVAGASWRRVHVRGISGRRMSLADRGRGVSADIARAGDATSGPKSRAVFRPRAPAHAPSAGRGGRTLIAAVASGEEGHGPGRDNPRRSRFLTLPLESGPPLPPFPLSCRQPRAVRWRRRPVELRQGHLLVAHHERGPVPHGRRRRGWCRGPPRPLLWPRWGPTPVRRGGGRRVAQPLPRGTQPPSLGLGRVVEPGPRRRRSQPPPPLPPRPAPCLCRRRLLVVLGASSSSSKRAGQQRLLDGLERCRLPHLEAAPNSRGARWCGPCRAGRRRGGGRDNRGRDWVGRGSGRGIGGCAGLAARHAGATLWCGGSLERRSRGGRCGGRGPAEPVPPLPPPRPRPRPRPRASEQWAHAPDPPWHNRRDAEVIAQAWGRGRAR